MFLKEFKEKLLEKFSTENYPERCFENLDSQIPNYYFQNYSAINIIHNGTYYDLEGGQVWVTVSYNKDFLIQLNLRFFDYLKTGKYQIDANTISGYIFFIYKWNNLGVYTMKMKDFKEMPKSFDNYKHCINNHFNTKFHYYIPSEEIAERYIELIKTSEKWINDHSKEIQEFLDKHITSISKSKKIFSQEFKESIKETFKDNYIIR